LADGLTLIYAFSMVDHFVGIASGMGQPGGPTQPSVPSGVSK